MSQWLKFEKQTYDFERLEQEQDIAGREDTEVEESRPHMKRTHIMESGQYVTLYDGKRLEEFNIEDRLRFMLDTDLMISGEVKDDTKRVLEKVGYTYSFEGLKIVVTQKEKLQEQAMVESEETKERKKSAYKGYAYAKNQKNPTIVYGDTREEICCRIQNWNKERTKNNQYMYVNIGQLSEDKYCDYIKYSPEGKDISNTYLELPSLAKEDFKKLTEQLKQDGAKYNPYQKKWYISADVEKEKFAEYITDTQGSVSENPLEQLIETEKVYFTVGINPQDNFCTVYLPGLEPVILDGSEYCVSFPTLPLEKVKEIVNQEIPKITSVEDNTLEQRLSMLNSSQLDYIDSKDELTPAQLNEVIAGFEQGYSTEEVDTYALQNLKPWQMELCRNGIYYGIKREEMGDILEPLNCGVDLKRRYERFERAAEEKRLDLARMINKTGFCANREIVSNVLNLNHVTKKTHTVEDLATAYKEQLYDSDPKASALVEKIGKEFSRQERERAIAR